MGNDVSSIARLSTRPLPPLPELSARVAMLQSSRLFAGLTSAECTSVAERGRVYSFARNEVLFMQGQPIQSLTILRSGCVKLTQLNSSGSEVILALRGSSESLDLPVIPGLTAHAVTAQAMIGGSLLTWGLATAESLVTTYPRFGRNICRILGEQLVDIQQRYCELSGERVERRVALALTRLANQIGTRSDIGTEVCITRQELGQMTGTTLFTVSRLISKWSDLGLVVPRREAVLILDGASLNLLTAADVVPFTSSRGPSTDPAGLPAS